MKNLKITLGLLAVAVSFTACTDEKKLQAEKDVAMYANYVDSVSNVEMNQAANDWDEIQKDYDRLKMNAENSLTGVEEDQKLKESKIKHSVIIGEKMPHIWPLLPLLKESKSALNKIIMELNKSD